MFLWTSTHDYAKNKRAGEAETVRLLNSAMPTAAVHLDLFFGLRRAKSVAKEPWFQLSTVFTADGDHQDDFEAAGVNHHFLLPAVYHAECELGTPRPEYKTDIVFVGAHTGSYHPEYQGRQELVAWLKETYGARCAFWPEPGRHAIRGQDLNDLYASAKVVVGDSCFADTATTYTSDRVFETVGRGGFLLYPRIPVLTDKLLDGVHLEYYTPRDYSGLRDQIDHWIHPDQDAERAAIQRAGCGYVRENHSYLNRMREMLEVMGLS